jgi:hypothetical protein
MSTLPKPAEPDGIVEPDLAGCGGPGPWHIDADQVLEESISSMKLTTSAHGQAPRGLRS